MSRRRGWSWHGLAALVLAICLGGSYAAVLVITALASEPITSDGAHLLTNLGGILAGALAGWLGGAAMHHDQQPPPEPEPEPDDDGSDLL